MEGGTGDPEEARRRRRRKEEEARGEEGMERTWEERRGREERMGVGGTAWEIAREAHSPPVLLSVQENWELGFMVPVLPPVISDADSIRHSHSFTVIQNSKQNFASFAFLLVHFAQRREAIKRQ